MEVFGVTTPQTWVYEAIKRYNSIEESENDCTKSCKQEQNFCY